MKRLLQLGVGLYVPHLIEEQLTGMADDPFIVAAFQPFAGVPPRRAAYLIFQLVLGSGLLLATLASLGSRVRRGLAVLFALVLIGESHHLLRWFVYGGYNPGLLTALPLPLLGVLIARSALGSPAVAANLRGEYA